MSVLHLHDSARSAPIGSRRRLGWLATAVALGLLLIGQPASVPARVALVGVIAPAGLFAALRSAGARIDPLLRGLAHEWSSQTLHAIPGWQVRAGVGRRADDADWIAATPKSVLAIQASFRDCIRRRAQVVRHQRELTNVRLAASALDDTRPVTPVLLLWGPGKPDLPAGYRVDEGVFVVDGDRPWTWQDVLAG